jgi:predicted nucleic acid-binding Zn ribbon protein
MKAVMITLTEAQHAVLCEIAEGNRLSVEDCVCLMVDEYARIRNAMMEAYRDDLSDVQVGGTA